MKGIIIALLYTILYISCTSNSNSDHLAQENIRLRLEKENLELAQEINDLKNKPKIQEAEEVKRLYMVWREREINKISESLNNHKTKIANLKNRQESGEKLSDEDNLTVALWPIGIEYFESAIDDLHSNKYYNKWDEARIRGTKLELLDTNGEFKH